MPSNQNSFEIEMGSERNFGTVVAAVFLIIGLYPLVADGSVHIWALVIAGVLILITLFMPGILKVPNRLWFKFGLALGAVVAPIVMALIFFLTVVPIGLFFRLRGKDLLYQNFDKDAESYWIKRNHQVRTMKDQF